MPLVFRGTFSSPEQLQKSLEKWKAEKSAVGADVEAEGTERIGESQKSPKKERLEAETDGVSLKIRNALFLGV